MKYHPKSIISAILILSILICLASCSANNEYYASNNSHGTHDDVSKQSDTSSNTAKDDTAIWIKNFYTNNFNEPTGKWYLQASFEGSFNNSAVTNEKLTVSAILDSDSFSLQLYEYNRNLVKNSASKKQYYNITVKHSNGDKEMYRGSIASGDSRLLIEGVLFDETVMGNTIDRVLRMLSDSKISLYIEERDRTINNYLVELNTEGLLSNYYVLLGETKPSGLRFELNDDKTTYSVTGLGDIDSSIIEIPSVYNEKPVTVVESGAFAGYKKLEKILISESVIEIKYGAFQYCTSLTEVETSNGLSVIGSKAFYQCWALSEVTLPATVEKIGWSAFSGNHHDVTVFYRGSEAEWNRIEIDDYNTALTQIIFNAK